MNTLFRITFLCCLLAGLTCFATRSKAIAPTPDTAANAKGDLLYCLDFSKCADGDAVPWLKKNGFELAKGMADPDDVKLSFKGGKLYVEALTNVIGLAIKGNLKLRGCRRIRIEWGVDQYPKGASYAKGVNNEAIMIYVYYGDEKLSSGSFFIPNSPYFVGLYLSQTDPVNKPFLGRHFKEQGRFICIGQPGAGKMVTSEFDLSTAFKTHFKKKVVPHISGFNIEVDTSYVSPGTSKAFVRKIEFIK